MNSNETKSSYATRMLAKLDTSPFKNITQDEMIEETTNALFWAIYADLDGKGYEDVAETLLFYAESDSTAKENIVEQRIGDVDMDDKELTRRVLNELNEASRRKKQIIPA